MKKIHSVLYIKFSKVLSNAYDKTGLVNHSTKPQRKEDGSSSQNNIVSSFYKLACATSQITVPQFLHKSWFKMTYITSTINFQSLFCRLDFLSLSWREYILFNVFSSEFILFSVFCFCLELIFLP